MNEKRIKKWGRTRKLGKFRFIIFYSLAQSLIFSIVMSLFNYFWETSIDGKENAGFNLTFAIVSFVIFFAVMLVGSNYIWNKTEKEYLAALEK